MELKIDISQIRNRTLIIVKSFKFWLSQGILFLIYMGIYLYSQSHYIFDFVIQYAMENISPILYAFGFSFFLICNFITKVYWCECDGWLTYCWRTMKVMTILFFTYGYLILSLFATDLDAWNSPSMITIGCMAICGAPFTIFFTSILCPITYFCDPS